MGKGLDYDQLFPGRFMKAGEFQGKDVTLTIASIELEDLPQEKGGDRARGVIGFNGTKKKLVLNRTNGECLKAMFGRDTGDWIGKRITLYPAPFNDPFTGAPGFCIRIKGSPDIAKQVDAQIKLAKRAPFTMTMLKTGEVAA